MGLIKLSGLASSHIVTWSDETLIIRKILRSITMWIGSNQTHHPLRKALMLS